MQGSAIQIQGTFLTNSESDWQLQTSRGPQPLMTLEPGVRNLSLPLRQRHADFCRGGGKPLGPLVEKFSGLRSSDQHRAVASFRNDDFQGHRLTRLRVLNLEATDDGHGQIVDMHQRQTVLLP